MLRDLLILTTMELRRYARTSDIFRYLLLPALLGIPTLLYVTTLLVSLRGGAGSLAVPLDLPEELDLVHRLESAEVKVIPSEDPYRAWESGRVDAAIVRLLEDDGIGGAEVEPLDREAWRLEIVSDSPSLTAVVRGEVEAAASDALSAAVALGGGQEKDRIVVRLSTVEAEEESRLPFFPKRGVIAYLMMGMSLIAFFTLCLPHIADRREGVLETLRVLPCSPTALLAARVLALLGLQLACLLLVGANCWLLAGAALGNVSLPSPWMAPAVIGGLLFADVSYLCVGVLAPTAKLANSFSGIPMTVQVGLLLAGMWKQLPLFGQAPAWLPLGGVLVVEGPYTCLISLVSSAGAGLFLLGVCGHLLATRVELLLRRGDE